MRNRKSIICLMIFVFVMLLSGCGRKYTCVECGSKVEVAYVDIEDIDDNYCIKCAVDYYGMIPPEHLRSDRYEGYLEQNYKADEEERKTVDEELEEAHIIKTKFTKEEILSMMENDGSESSYLLAVKKGNVYYTTELLDYEDYEFTTAKREYIKIGTGNWNCPDIDLAAGDQIVIFSENDNDYSVEISKIIDLFYCIPLWFNEHETETGFEMSVDEQVFWMDLEYPSGNIIEMNGEVLSGNPLYYFLIPGRKGEVVTLGGYNGTIFEEYSYSCDMVGCILDFYYTDAGVPGQYRRCTNLDIRTSSGELTKEGYKILISDTINTLEPGQYLLGSTMINVVG